MIPRMRRDE